MFSKNMLPREWGVLIKDSIMNSKGTRIQRIVKLSKLACKCYNRYGALIVEEPARTRMNVLMNNIRTDPKLKSFENGQVGPLPSEEYWDWCLRIQRMLEIVLSMFNMGTERDHDDTPWLRKIVSPEGDIRLTHIFSAEQRHSEVKYTSLICKRVGIPRDISKMISTFVSTPTTINFDEVTVKRRKL